ncbi:dehydrogenase [Spirochaetia bacterium]|nr:dehydrogenase [Spirochaetia bacterium]
MSQAVVLFHTDQSFRGKLEQILSGMTVVYPEQPGALDPQTEIIFGNPDPHDLHSYPVLKWIQLQSAGSEGYTAQSVPAGVVVSNATGAYGHAISEHMVACVFSLYKRLHQYRDEQNRGAWQPRGHVKSIEGSVVLAVGLGDIGGEFARRMKALGAYTIGVRRIRTEKPAFVDEVLLIDQLDAVLPRADIIALSLPGTSGTAGLFDRNRLSIMKKGAIIVNIGRGSAIDTEALCDRLESGFLGGAALDVTDPEPLPTGHRLWHLENAIITPHISGGFSMHETYEAILEICLNNALRYKNGEPLRNIVDFSTGYRKNT